MAIPKVIITRVGKEKKKCIRYYYLESYESFDKAKKAGIEHKKRNNSCYHILVTGELFNKE